MALVRDFVLKRYPKIASIIKEERNKLNLKAVERVTVRFDPFRDDASEIRKFTNILYAKDTCKTNQRCILKTEILTDRSEQTITFDLAGGKQIIFKCANLKSYEIYKLMNQYITPLAPKETEVSSASIKTAKKMTPRK